jgi:hypothetical protein
LRNSDCGFAFADRQPDIEANCLVSNPNSEIRNPQ